MFPDGQKGYLPALGELNVFLSRKAAVFSAIQLIGGTAMTNGYYWSSTQKDHQSSWYCFITGGYSYGTKNYNYCGVRAFAPYGYINITSNIETNFTLEYINNYNEKVTSKAGIGGTSINVKIGTQVTVTPDLPYAEPQIFVWQGFTHECDFVFSKDAGVYIQHVNGSLYTESEWTANDYTNNDANGVAVLSSDVSFVIAKQNVSNYAKAWGGFNYIVEGVLMTSSSADACLDYDGINNTQKIIKQLDGFTNSGVTGSPAAEACANFIFPNGKKGYLPALGEWKLIWDNKAAVVSAMSLIGGTAISYEAYWSSTQNSAYSSWANYWPSSAATAQSKANSACVRAFADL